MHNECLHRRHYNKDKTLKNVDLSAKFNQESSIHVVTLTYGSRNVEKSKIKEVRLR